jgi:osmotically-inducible protein OsmY
MAVPPDVVTAVRGALGSEPRVGVGQHRISLQFDRGDLTIEGEVADAAAKKLALERAAQVDGVRHIVDRLRVEPSRRMSDAEIRDHLRDVLRGEPELGGVGVRVAAGPEPMSPLEAFFPFVLDATVREGVVTLSGEVPSLCHKRLAGVLAWWVPGTRDVVNGLEVVPPERDDDDELREAVRVVLEKDPLVDAPQVSVAVHDSTVTLDGALATPAQRRMAELDAWYVFGVDRVVNRIAVRSP